MANQTLVFGSEIKAVLANPHVDRSIDRSALFDFLTYLYIPAPKTAYEYIRKLQPGHVLVFESESVDIRQYWDVSFESQTAVRNVAEACELTRELLAEVVDLHTVSDVPVGVFLSGGVDSSTVVALMSQVNSQPISTFSIGFDVPEHSETEYARLVAAHCGTRHYERIVGVQSAQMMLPLVSRMYDEPYADGSAVPTYQVSALAREQVKVVLSGDGGDEVFAGYNWYTAWLTRRSLQHIPQLFGA